MRTMWHRHAAAHVLPSIRDRRAVGHDLLWLDQQLAACGDHLDQVLELVVRQAVDVVGEAAVLTVATPDGGTLEPAVAYHPDPAFREQMRAVLQQAPKVVDQGMAGAVAADARPMVLSNIDATTLSSVVPGACRRFVARHRVRSIMVVPLVLSGEVFGTLGLIRSDSDAPYTRAELFLVEAIAERASLAIADSRRVPQRLGLADYEAIVRWNLDGVLVTAPDGRILAANPAACAILRLSEAEICRRGSSGVAVDEDPRWIAALETRRATGSVRAELPMQRGNGHRFAAEVSSTVFTTRDGRQRACLVFRDVSEELETRVRLEAEREHLERLAEKDTLTGLRNRHGFTVAAEQSLTFADRSGVDLELVFCDLDGLKTINDSHGHLVGDEVIKAFGAAISGAIRAVDTGARLGGDEFVVLLYAANGHDAARVVKRIRGAFARGTDLVPTPTFSAGVAWRPAGSGITLDDLLGEADQAMYKTKALARMARRRAVDPDATAQTVRR